MNNIDTRGFLCASLLYNVGRLIVMNKIVLRDYLLIGDKKNYIKFDIKCSLILTK